VTCWRCTCGRSMAGRRGDGGKGMKIHVNRGIETRREGEDRAIERVRERKSEGARERERLRYSCIHTQRESMHSRNHFTFPHWRTASIITTEISQYSSSTLHE
jgi:hypothetical protein